MNSLPNIQNTGLLAWDGTTAYARRVSRHRNFGWSLEIVTTIATAAVFRVEAAPASAADPCVPGTFVDVPEVAVCLSPVEPGDQTTFTIPAGTTAGTVGVPAVCSVTLPCVPNDFVRLVAVSGDTANVRAVLVLQGPIGP